MDSSNELHLTSGYVPALRLTPLEWAARHLSDILQRVQEIEDTGGDIDQALVLAFQDAKGDLQYGIDCRQAFSKVLKDNIEGARGYRKQVDAYVQRLKRLDERLKDDALKAVEVMAAEQAELRGSNGKKIYVSKSAPSLKLSFDIKESRTFTNILDAETVDFLEIDTKYLQTVSFTVLDTEAVKADLKLGIKLDWASLEVGRHVRGL